MRRQHLEFCAALLTAGVFAALLVQALGYRGGSGMMPRAVLIIALGLTGLWLVQTLPGLLSSGQAPLRLNMPVTLRFLALLGGTMLAVAGISTIGYFTSAAIMLPAMAVALGYRKPVPLIIGTCAFTAVLFSVFHLLLKIPLPPEAIFSILG